MTEYLRAVDRAMADIIKIGFRFTSKSGFLGPFSYTTDEFLRTLPLPSHSKIAVMINAADYMSEEVGVSSDLIALERLSPADFF